jgi:microcystin-dependent protein
MKTHVIRHSLLVTAAALAIALAAANTSAAPAEFSYQGVLRNAEGEVPANKNLTVEFKLYTQAEGGSPVWGRAVAVLLDNNGLFNAELSDSAGSPIEGVTDSGLASILASKASSTLYIGIKVAGTSGEIAPRQTILPVPYAMVAADVASASGDLDVAGQISAASVTVAGSLASSSITVSGNASVGGNLTVDGAVSGYGTAPIGCIILWSGAVNKIPEGWALCNGQTVGGQKTPNLSGRFVVGYDAGDGDYNAVGRTGGEKTHKLTIAEMPSHNHSITMWGGDIDDDWKQQNNLYLTHNKYNYNNNRTTDSAGGDLPHENRPPYYTLCYIMRVR